MLSLCDELELIERNAGEPRTDVGAAYGRRFKFTYQDKALVLRSVVVEASGYGEALPMAYEHLFAGEKLVSIECLIDEKMQ